MTSHTADHWYPGCWESDVVKQLREMASSSHALVLISPEYHGTMSSTMKLQLDWLSKEQLAGKPVALVSLLGGKSNTSTLNHMRHVCRWLGALCIPEQIAIPTEKPIWRRGDLHSDLSESWIRTGIAFGYYTKTPLIR